MHTILLGRVVILKKIIVGIVFLILIITVYFVVIKKNSEEKIEISLVKSMEDTQQEKDVISGELMSYSIVESEEKIGKGKINAKKSYAII